ncbi:MAG: hypothetical protein JWR39_708, partial [Devosia sp.]|nr:hypothetical protein [Devosia sp.]
AKCAIWEAYSECERKRPGACDWAVDCIKGSSASGLNAYRTPITPRFSVNENSRLLEAVAGADREAAGPR